MKRFFPLAAFLGLFLLWGCPQKEKEQPVLSASQIEYKIGADGGEVTILFKTNQDCSIESNASWLKVVTKGTKAVRMEKAVLAAEPNPSENQRSGKVTVTGGTLSIEVVVVQEPKSKDKPDGPNPPDPEDPDLLENAGQATYNIPCDGGSFSVKVRSNVDYTYESGADWITQTKAKTTREDNISFTVAANSGAMRVATVTFSWGDAISFDIKVRQDAHHKEGDVPYLEVSPKEIVADATGGDYAINILANYSYSVLCAVDWVDVVEQGTTCLLRFEPNAGEESRSAEIIFMYEELEETVTVSQSGMNEGTDPFYVGSNLSSNGHANCYIVTRPGNYSFDVTVMGNGPEGFIWEGENPVTQNLWPWEIMDVSFTNYGNDGPSAVKVLWDDGGVVTDVTISNLKVYFTATGNKGSALIAVYDRMNTLLWSWHIWCTDSPKRIRHEVDGLEIVMLDRNLGATSVNPADGQATYGYWYQFGRKDPLKLFPDVAGTMRAGEQSMQHSVEHPTAIYQITGKATEWFNGSVETITADLWGNPYAMHNGADHVFQASMSELRKTIYDPCPPGYMVPPEWAWDSFTMDDCTVSDYGLTFIEDNGESFYPFAGFGDSGDQWGGDSGWYGYPGYTPRKNPSDGKYHHNCRNVVACWSSASAYHFDPQWNSTNYQHAHMFFYLQDEEASNNVEMVNANSAAHLYPRYSHIRERCCSVRCMKMQ